MPDLTQCYSGLWGKGDPQARVFWWRGSFTTQRGLALPVGTLPVHYDWEMPDRGILSSSTLHKSARIHRGVRYHLCLRKTSVSDWRADEDRVWTDYEGVAGLWGHRPSEREGETCRGHRQMFVWSQRGERAGAAGLHHQHRCKFDLVRRMCCVM